jgi:hypothetical protein
MGNMIIMALSGLAAQKPGFTFSLMAEGEPFSQRLGNTTTSSPPPDKIKD